jgi:hypothetical protein
MNDILALNHKDPVRSLVSLRQNFMCAPVIGSIMPGAELTNPPTTQGGSGSTHYPQGVMIDFSCEDCCDEPGLLCLGIRYDPDGRTRLYWRYPTWLEKREPVRA